MSHPDYEKSGVANKFTFDQFLNFFYFKHSRLDTFLLSAYLYAETTPASYHMLCKYVHYVYPVAEGHNQYLKEPYEFLKKIYLNPEGSASTLGNVLPRYPRLKIQDSLPTIIEKNQHETHMIFYKEENPHPEDGFALPTIVSLCSAELFFSLVDYVIKYLFNPVVNKPEVFTRQNFFQATNLSTDNNPEPSNYGSSDELNSRK